MCIEDLCGGPDALQVADGEGIQAHKLARLSCLEVLRSRGLGLSKLQDADPKLLLAVAVTVVVPTGKGPTAGWPGRLGVGPRTAPG